MITREQVKEVAVKMFNADSNINQADKPAYEFEGAFIYENQDGEFLHARPRFRNPLTGNKWIRALSFDGTKPVYKMPEYPNGKPLYNLPKIKDADVVYFVEGEKVAAWLGRIGLVATTCGGAQDHDKADLTPLRGKTVYLWPDFDEAGKKHMQAVKSLLIELGCTTHLIDIDALGLPPKGDAFDYLKAHHAGIFNNPSAEVLKAAKDAVLGLALVAKIEAENLIKPETQRETKPSTAIAKKPQPEIKVNLINGADIKMRPITWLWDMWLPSGKLTMLGGAGGTGKTTLALGLASTITTGGIFPDHSRYCGKSNVLIWSSEDDPEDVLMPRLMAMGADRTRIYILTGSTEDGKRRGFDPVADIEVLKQAINNVGGVALIIIDPIVGMVKGNMNNANEVRQSLDPLVEFAQDQQCAIIGISHLGKGSQGKDPAERLLGSQAFTALPRMVWVTVTNKETQDRVLVRAKTNISPKDGGFTYSIEQKEIDGIHTSIVMWKDAVEGYAHDILSDAESIDEDGEDAYGTETDRDFAKQFLTDILGSQDRIGNEVKSEAKDADISAATLRRASEELGIKKYKSITLGKYVWSLRNSTEKEAMQLAYSGCSTDGGQVAHSSEGEQPEQPEQPHIDKGSQLAQISENKQVAHLAHHFDSEQAGGNLAQNPTNGAILTKQELDESGDRFRAEEI